MERHARWVADCDRRHWLGDVDPPGDHIETALSCLGLTVVMTELQGIQGRLDITSSTILINKRLPLLVGPLANPWAMRLWTIVHEIAHHQLHRWQFSRGIVRPGHERQAEAYASEFLMPEAQVRDSLPWRELLRCRREGTLTDTRRRDLAHSLGDRFRVSSTAAQVRVSELLATTPVMTAIPPREEAPYALKAFG